MWKQPRHKHTCKHKHKCKKNWTKYIPCAYANVYAYMYVTPIHVYFSHAYVYAYMLMSVWPSPKKPLNANEIVNTNLYHACDQFYLFCVRWTHWWLWEWSYHGHPHSYLFVCYFAQVQMAFYSWNKVQSWMHIRNRHRWIWQSNFWPSVENLCCK